MSRCRPGRALLLLAPLLPGACSAGPDPAPALRQAVADARATGLAFVQPAPPPPATAPDGPPHRPAPEAVPGAPAEGAGAPVGAPGTTSGSGTRSAAPATPRPDPAPSRRRPPATAAALLGAAPDALRHWLGDPALRRPEGEAEVWLYLGQDCALDLVLYRTGAGLRVAHAAARANGPAATTERGCLHAIAGDPRAGDRPDPPAAAATPQSATGPAPGPAPGPS